MSRIIIEGKQYRYKCKDVAVRLGVHINTVTNVLNQGESHPKYRRLMKVIRETGER
jgi:DNA-binding LacI/PurR family transcriptional regulator